MAVNFDDQSTGRSYDNYPKDPEAREQIAIVKDKVEKLVNTTVSRQIVTNLENKFKQNELDNENYRNQVAETVQTIEEKVDGLDGGNTEKIANLEAVVNEKANKDIVDSLLNQIEGSVKQINGVAPDENGNVAIDLNTQGLVSKIEFGEKTDQIAVQLMEKANTAEIDNLLMVAEGLTAEIETKANQREINEAKGSFTTLKQKLDNMVISGGGGGSIQTIDLLPDSTVKEDTTVPPKDTATIFIKSSTRTSMIIGWDLVPLRAVEHKVYVDGIYHSTHSYIDRKTEITGLAAYTGYSIRVTSIDEIGNESVGKVTLCRTTGYALKMNGKTYVKTASLQFDRLVLDFMLDKENGTGSAVFMDGRTALSNSHVSFNGATEIWGDYFNTRILDGVTLPSNNNGPWITSLKPSVLDLRRSSTIPTAPINIFAHSNSGSNAKGELYRVQLYYQNVLIADYDFRKGVYTDQTGKGNQLLVTGGEFI